MEVVHLEMEQAVQHTKLMVSHFWKHDDVRKVLQNLIDQLKSGRVPCGGLTSAKQVRWCSYELIHVMNNIHGRSSIALAVILDWNL